MHSLSTLILYHPYISAVLAGGVGAPAIAFILSMARKVGSFGATTLIHYLAPCKALNDDSTVAAVLGYLTKHGREFGLAKETFDARKANVQALDESRIVFYRQLSKGARVFLYRRAVLFFSPYEQISDARGAKATIRFLKGTVNWNQLLCDAAKMGDDVLGKDTPKTRFRVIRHTGSAGTSALHNDNSPGDVPKDTTISGNLNPDIPVNYREDELGYPPTDEPLKNLSLTQEMELVLKTARFWLSHKNWYRERGLTWKRGVLLYGEPGTGKTSIARAVAEELDLPVHTFDLASMDNSDFIQAWRNTREDGPRIVLLEDFDAVFKKRTPTKANSGLTFETILNVMDGIEREDGLLLYITTNHIEHIDPALGTLAKGGGSTRPGRIDDVIELKGLDRAGRVKVALRIVQDPQEAERLADEGALDTPAKFTERAMKCAIEHLWGTTTLTHLSTSK